MKPDRIAEIVSYVDKAPRRKDDPEYEKMRKYAAEMSEDNAIEKEYGIGYLHKIIQEHGAELNDATIDDCRHTIRAKRQELEAFHTKKLR